MIYIQYMTTCNIRYNMRGHACPQTISEKTLSTIIISIVIRKQVKRNGESLSFKNCKGTFTVLWTLCCHPVCQGSELEWSCNFTESFLNSVGPNIRSQTVTYCSKTPRDTAVLSKSSV